LIFTGGGGGGGGGRGGEGPLLTSTVLKLCLFSELSTASAVTVEK